MNSLIGQDNASSAANTINRMFMNNKENNSNTERMQDGSALTMLSPTLELKPKDDNSFMIQKQHISYDESSRNNEFGFVTSDSLATLHANLLCSLLYHHRLQQHNISATLPASTVNIHHRRTLRNSVLTLRPVHNPAYSLQSPINNTHT